MMGTDAKCGDKVRTALTNRLADIRKLWKAYQSGDEDKYSEDIGTFPEYGLCFDYVAPETFTDQPRGYFRYQISYGGPSEEFRFYTDESLDAYKIEFWLLDWFDGAKRNLNGKRFELMSEIFDFFKEIGSVEAEYQKAIAA